MRPGHSVWPKIRLTESETDLITILRCFLSFKTVLTSRNIIVFKIFFSGKKTAIWVVHALWYLVPLADRYLPFCPILSRSTGFQMHYLNYLIFSFWTIISYYLIRWKIEISYYFTYFIPTLSICCIGPGIIYNYFVYYDTIIALILYLYLSFNYFFWKVLLILYQCLFLNLFYSLTKNDVMRMKDIQQLKIRNLWQQGNFYSWFHGLVYPKE